MGMLLQVLKEFAACMMALVMTALGGLLPAQPPSFAAEEPDALQAQFSVFSDVHVDIYQLPDYINRMTMLRKGLGDVAGSAQETDALIFLGDTIDEGQWEEYIFFYLYLSLFNKLPRSSTMLALGNHEWYNTGDYAHDFGRFRMFYEGYTKQEQAKPYYAKEINGYRYIVLGSESSVNDQGDLSAAQNAWLDEQLALGTQDGKPVFVFNHQPFYGTHNTWGGEGDIIAEQYAAVYQTLAKYDNVFFFSGHLHQSLSSGYSFETTPEGVHLLNLPSFGKESDQGIGFQAEIYNDRVLLRARNFGRGAWLEEYVYDVPVIG